MILSSSVGGRVKVFFGELDRSVCLFQQLLPDAGKVVSSRSES